MALADTIQKRVLERIVPCELPIWAQDKFRGNPLKQGRIHLANLPTPLYPLYPNSQIGSSKPTILQQLAEKGVSFYIKRDDMSGGVELGGEYSATMVVLSKVNSLTLVPCSRKRKQGSKIGIFNG